MVFIKGQTAWNKGKPAPWARTEFLVPACKGEKNINWKGNRVGISDDYVNKSWITRKKQYATT